MIKLKKGLHLIIQKTFLKMSGVKRFPKENVTIKIFNHFILRVKIFRPILRPSQASS